MVNLEDTMQRRIRQTWKDKHCRIPLVVSQFSSVQFSCSIMSDSLRPHGLQNARLSCPSTNSQFKLLSIQLDDAIQPSHPLLSSSLSSIFPSIRVFSNESVLCISWPKYWSFNFSISPSNECSGLISFRMDWLDLLAVQGTLKSLFQQHTSEASILRAQLSL